MKCAICLFSVAALASGTRPHLEASLAEADLISDDPKKDAKKDAKKDDKADAKKDDKADAKKDDAKADEKKDDAKKDDKTEKKDDAKKDDKAEKKDGAKKDDKDEKTDDKADKTDGKKDETAKADTKGDAKGDAGDAKKDDPAGGEKIVEDEGSKPATAPPVVASASGQRPTAAAAEPDSDKGPLVIEAIRNNQRGRWVWVDAEVGSRGQDDRYPNRRYNDHPQDHHYYPGHPAYPDPHYHPDWANVAQEAVEVVTEWDKGKGKKGFDGPGPQKGKGKDEPCDDDGKGKGKKGPPVEYRVLGR